MILTKVKPHELKALRQQAGYKYASDLAREIGCDRSTITKIETNFKPSKIYADKIGIVKMTNGKWYKVNPTSIGL